MINSNYPFLINFKDSTLTVLESVTCLACASKNNMIISLKDFKIKTKK